MTTTLCATTFSIEKQGREGDGERGGGGGGGSPLLWERRDMRPWRHVSVTSEMLQATRPMASMVAAANCLSGLEIYVCVVT